MQNNCVMILEIITPEKKAFEGEVTSVKFPGISGGFEILNNHAPIISTLGKGDIRVITADKKTENFAINGGVIEMKNNKIIVLAE
jgi:F-type H+-transporting ATPase subunit epsilon|tara:strand:+ start:3914 stop:4168 length:255 start_codon:yes stop_codon:yes gene_type:complete